MGLLDTVRNAVATAKAATADLQASVTHRSVIGSPSSSGVVPLGPPISRPALVTRIQKLVRSSSGQMVMSHAQVVFLDPAVVINELDEIVLPDGTTAPILSTEGFVDRGTGHPILTEVFLGASNA
jgi:hypothetical protein